MIQPLFDSRSIRCPSCGGPSRYAPENRFRPFCSERCKLRDLGAWASESFHLTEADGGELERRTS
mgnify:CR=1 FL=1